MRGLVVKPTQLFTVQFRLSCLSTEEMPLAVGGGFIVVSERLVVEAGKRREEKYWESRKANWLGYNKGQNEESPHGSLKNRFVEALTVLW